MKIATLTGLTALGCTLIASQQADAAYMGLGGRLHTSVNVGGSLRAVYRMYAIFSDENDYLTSISGSSLSGPLTIKSMPRVSGGPGMNFFNPPSGGDTAPPTSGGVYSPAAAQWDTFATIGADHDDVNDPFDDLTSLSPGFPNFIQGNSLTSDNLVWVTSGGAIEQGRAGGPNGINGTFYQSGLSPGFYFPITGYGVLFAQLTVNAGQGVIGTVAVGVQESEGLAGGFTIANQTFLLYIPVPSPGAFALLGVAGLLGPRRRRL